MAESPPAEEDSSSSDEAEPEPDDEDCERNFCYGCGMVVKVKPKGDDVCRHCSSDDLESMKRIKHQRGGANSSDSSSSDSSEEGACGGIKKKSVLWMILDDFDNQDRQKGELGDQTHQEMLYENAELRKRQRRSYRPTLHDRLFSHFVMSEMADESPSYKIAMGKLLRRDAHLFPGHDVLADKLCEDEIKELEYMKLHDLPLEEDCILELFLITKEQVGLQCSICKEDYIEADKAVKLDCRHMYHQRCLVPWLESMRDTCPDCRRRIDHWKIEPTLQKLYTRPRPRGSSLPAFNLVIRGQTALEGRRPSRRTSAPGNQAAPDQTDQRPRDWIVFD